MVSKGMVIQESVGVLAGKVSFSQLVLWIFSTLGFEILFIKGVETMEIEFFFIPENMILFTIAMAVGGVLGALGWGAMMKAENGADEPWKMKYVASMFVTMVLAPIVTNLVLGAIAQEYYPEMNDLTYCMFLILGTFAVARYTLLFFNEGLKKTVRMLKSNIKTTQEAVEEIKEIVPPKTL